MKLKMPLRESEMLQNVRRWRREAYLADPSRSPEERARRTAEMLERYGLRRAARSRRS